MPDKMGALSKVLPTFGAAKRPFSSVGTEVANQISTKAERLGAFPARKWPLPRVEALVLSDFGALREAFPTDGANVGFFSGMDPFVLDKIRAMTEAPSTLRTGERALTCMCPLMNDEVGALRETFATVSTAVWLLTCVRTHMLDQVRVLTVALITVGAFVGFLACVDSTMANQMRAVTKAFPTVRADGGFRDLVNLRKVVCRVLPYSNNRSTVLGRTLNDFHPLNVCCDDPLWRDFLLLSCPSRNFLALFPFPLWFSSIFLGFVHHPKVLWENNYIKGFPSLWQTEYIYLYCTVLRFGEMVEISF